VLGLLLLSGRVAGSETPPDIELFTRTGCPHCERAKEYLETLAAERPGLVIAERPVDTDPEARERLHQLFESHGVDTGGVPAFHLHERLVVGFLSRETTGREIEAILDSREESVETGVFGRLSVSRLGLPLFTVALGLVDGFNPCAMWVLLFLLSLLVHVGSRRRMALVAGTFVLVSGLAYYAFMAAWLNLFLLIGILRPVQVALALVAGAAGALHLKEALAPGRGPSLTIPESAKPGLYTRMRAIVRAENLGAALAGIFVLALLVNAVELLCTAGLPALYTETLSLQDLDPLGHHAYLALYVVAYMADDSLAVGLAIATLGHRKLSERGGRWLQALSGSVMLALAGFLLFAPAWLR
jgi:glutaredoxin